MTRVPQGLRFQPPALELEPEHRWLLLRAFGPADASSEGIDPVTAWNLAGRCGVAPRIGARTARDRLELELGGLAAEARSAARMAGTHSLAYDDVAAAISAAARELDTPVVFLKGFALAAAGIATPGSRDVGDLDCLVDPEYARRFFDHLLGAGFRPAESDSNEQHLPPLQAPGWGNVDLHYALRGVGDSEGGWLSASQALAFGRPLEVRPGCWVPDRQLLAAHAISHALEQHSLSPQAYPLLRAIGDLIDLLPTEDDWCQASPRLTRWLETTVSATELEATRELCLRLGAGNLPRPDSPAGLLLTHFLAHRLDDRYRAGLAGRNRRHRLRQAWQRGTLLKFLHRKVNDLRRRS